MQLTDEQVGQLTEVMQRCGQASYDDTSCSFGSPKPEGGWNRSANSFEAGAALQEVAEILGIDGPDEHEERLAS
jgi:hypothetical protein